MKVIVYVMAPVTAVHEHVTYALPLDHDNVTVDVAVRGIILDELVPVGEFPYELTPITVAVNETPDVIVKVEFLLVPDTPVAVSTADAF